MTISADLAISNSMSSSVPKSWLNWQILVAIFNELVDKDGTTKMYIPVHPWTPSMEKPQVGREYNSFSPVLQGVTQWAQNSSVTPGTYIYAIVWRTFRPIFSEQKLQLIFIAVQFHVECQLHIDGSAVAHFPAIFVCESSKFIC